MRRENSSLHVLLKSMPEPFDRRSVWAAMDVSDRPAGDHVIARTLENWFHAGRLERVRCGTRDRDGVVAQYRRSASFHLSLRESRSFKTESIASRIEAPVALSDRELRWREFRSTINTDVPEIKLRGFGREDIAA